MASRGSLGSNVGQCAIAYPFVGVGIWTVAVFCAACLATAQLKAWRAGEWR